MTNAHAFFESLINVDHTILGKRLKPLCLLHLLWLYHIKSPLVYTSLECTMEDLELAVLICSNSSSGKILKAITPKRFKYHLWHRANKKRELKAELLKWVEYNNDYLSLPTFYPRGNEETDEKLPWLITTAASVIKETGWSDEQVFAMPIGKLLWWNIAFNYLATGKTNIMSDKEQWIIKNMPKC
jgi:hypothetical protein